MSLERELEIAHPVRILGVPQAQIHTDADHVIAVQSRPMEGPGILASCGHCGRRKETVLDIRPSLRAGKGRDDVLAEASQRMTDEWNQEFAPWVHLHRTCEKVHDVSELLTDSELIEKAANLASETLKTGALVTTHVLLRYPDGVLRIEDMTPVALGDGRTLQDAMPVLAAQVGYLRDDFKAKGQWPETALWVFEPTDGPRTDLICFEYYVAGRAFSGKATTIRGGEGEVGQPGVMDPKIQWAPMRRLNLRDGLFAKVIE